MAYTNISTVYKNSVPTEWTNFDSYNNEVLPMNDNFSTDSEWATVDNVLEGTPLSKIEKEEKPVEKVKSIKLSHREWLNIYNNPELNEKKQFENSLKHVLKCDICKSHISSKKITVSPSKPENTEKNKYKEELLNNKIKNLQHQMNLQAMAFSTKNEKINPIREEVQPELIKSTIMTHINDMENKKDVEKKFDKIYKLINELESKNSGLSVTTVIFIVMCVIIIILLFIDILVRIKYSQKN